MRNFLFFSLFLLSSSAVYSQQTLEERDTYVKITRAEFDRLVDSCIVWLKTKEIRELTDDQNRSIIRCLNTIERTKTTPKDFRKRKQRFKGGRYDRLEAFDKRAAYSLYLTNHIYKDWTLNRGMGFYFPKINIERAGTCFPFSMFEVD